VSPEILKLRPQQTPNPQPTNSPAMESQATAKIVKLPRRKGDEREFLPAALEIIDTPPSPVGRAVGLCIMLMAVAALVWACIGKIDIIATAPGHITAQGKTKVVQPVETGMVSAIRVADGAHVKAGDILIELNATQAEADRDRFQRDLLQVRLNISRLKGLARQFTDPQNADRPSLADVPQDATPEDIALAQAAMLAQAAQQTAKLADLDQQIASKQAAAAESAATVDKLQASLPMIQGQEQIRRDLKDSQFGNKLAWFQVNQQLIEQTKEVGVEGQRKQAGEAAEQALKQQRMATVAEYQVGVLQDLDKFKAQASELQAELTKAQERVRQSVLVAPIDGTVQQLSVHTVGGVVTPAQALLAVVPDEDRLIVEAMVQNRDVGFIKAGQAVRVKVDAFNFTRYGLIDGTVLDVTRDVVSQSDGDKKQSKAGGNGESDGMGADGANAPVYIARIALSTDTISTESGPSKVGPGMQVSAEIQTGQRRVIEYLLSPIVKHVDESLKER
jgi:hemolysin D